MNLQIRGIRDTKPAVCRNTMHTRCPMEVEKVFRNTRIYDLNGDYEAVHYHLVVNSFIPHQQLCGRNIKIEPVKAQSLLDGRLLLPFDYKSYSCFWKNPVNCLPNPNSPSAEYKFNVFSIERSFNKFSIAIRSL